MTAAQYRWRLVARRKAAAGPESTHGAAAAAPELELECMPSLVRVCLFVFLFILGRKLNRQNCLLKEVLREREEKAEKEKKKSN